MSFKKFRFVDLVIFSVIYLILEYLVASAAIVWFPETIYIVSFMLPILLIMIMRWDYYSLPFVVIFAAFYVLVTRRPGTLELYIIYILGNLSLIIPCVIIKKIKKENVSKKWTNTLVYIVVSYILVELFRGIGAIIFANQGLEIIPQYLLTDSLNLFFTSLVVLIGRLSPGLFTDQKHHLLMLEEERNHQLDDISDTE